MDTSTTEASSLDDTYTTGWRWPARLAGVAAAITLALTLPVTYLAVDLLVWRGVVPEYAMLPGGRQADFRGLWDRSLATDTAVGEALLKVRPADAEVTADANQKWAWRWQAFNYLTFSSRVGSAAAEAYLAPTEVNGQTVPGLTPTGRRLGILSLLARENPRWTTGPLAAISRVLPWTWNSTNDTGTNTPYLTGLFAVLTGLAVLYFGLRYSAERCAALACLEASARLRRTVFNHANRLGQLVVRRSAADEAAELLTHRLDVVQEGIRSELAHRWRTALAIVLLLTVLLIVNPWVAICFLLAAAAIWLTAGQLAAYMSRDGRIAARRVEARSSQLRESLSIVQLVKCYLMERFNMNRVERQLADHSRAERRRLRSDALTRPVLLMFATIGGLGLIYVAGHSVLVGEMSFAGLVVKGATVFALVGAVSEWVTARVRAVRASEALAEVNTFLARRADGGQPITAEFLQPLAQKMELIGLTYREPGTGRMLLENITYSLPARARVAVVASDPDESHTLAYLLTRFLDPTGGEIKFDGKNIRWVTHESLRTQLALVMQQTLVFSDTVANNIGCGDPSYTLPQLMEAAKTAHAHQFIQRLPYGYETLIGNSGHVLRPGEMLRLALARAVLRDPSVMVIEEPETTLDVDSRTLLDDSYHRIGQTRTLIFLSRRQSVLRSSDVVLVLHNGALVLTGEHDKLLAGSDLYRHLLFKEAPVAAGAA